MNDEQVLREILKELRKINEYIDMRKAKELNTINSTHLSSKNKQLKQFTFQEVLQASRRCLRE